MNYNIKTIRDALSAACGVSQELMHDALAALAELEKELAAAVAERDELRAYKQSIDSAPVVAWQPIESAPNDRRIVMAYFGHEKSWAGIASVGYFFKWDSMPKRVAACWPVQGCDPTHWMPLPDTQGGTELIAKPAKD